MADEPIKENLEEANRQAEELARQAKEAADEYDRLLLATQQRSIFESQISKQMIESQGRLERLIKRTQLFTSHHKEVVQLYDKMLKDSQKRSTFENLVLNKMVGQKDLMAQIVTQKERMLDANERVALREAEIAKIQKDAAATLAKRLREQGNSPEGSNYGGRGYFAKHDQKIFEELERNAYRMLAVTSTQADLDELLLDIGKDISDEKIEAAANLSSAFMLTKKIIPYEKELQEIMSAKNRLADSLNGENSELLEKYDKQIEMLQRQSKHTQRLTSLANMVEPAIQRANMASGGLVGKFTSMFGILGLIVGLIATPFIIGLKMAFGVMNRLDDAAVRFRENTGMTINMMGNLRSAAESVAMQFYTMGVDFNDAYDAISGMMGTISSAYRPTQDMIGLTAVLSRNFSISAETSAGVLQTLTAMSGASQETVGSMMGQITAMSEAAGLAPVDAFKDIAENSGAIFTYMRGNVPNMIKAAIEARRMGTSLNQMASTAASLLDFQSSIDAEMEASVLLGRQVNFGYARQLAFLGDMEGMQNEVLDVIQSIGDFTQMNAFEQKALADAAGMEVEEIHKILANRKLVGSMTSEQLAVYNKLTDELKAQVDLDEGNLDTQLKTLSAQHNQITQAENIKKQWELIGIQFGRVMIPLARSIYRIMQRWLGLLQEIWPNTKQLSGSFENIGSWLEDINESVIKWINKNGGLETVIQNVTDKIADLLGGVKAVSEFLVNWGPWVLGGYAALRTLIGGFSLATTAAQTFAGFSLLGFGPPGWAAAAALAIGAAANVARIALRQSDEEKERMAAERLGAGQLSDVVTGVPSVRELTRSRDFSSLPGIVPDGDEERLPVEAEEALRVQAVIPLETNRRESDPVPEDINSTEAAGRRTVPVGPQRMQDRNTDLSDSLLTQIGELAQRDFTIDPIDISDTATAGELAIVEQVKELNRLLSTGALTITMNAQKVGEMVAKSTPGN